MTFTVEPMLTSGRPTFHQAADGWTEHADDNRPSAQFEHTVLVTDTGAESSPSPTTATPPLEPSTPCTPPEDCDRDPRVPVRADARDLTNGGVVDLRC